MTMTMNNSFELQAPAQRVWERLLDPEVLKASIPGCQTLEKTSDTSYSAVVKTKIGPVSVTFKGHVTLTDLEPPFRCRIVGEGDGGISGFAKGHSDVRLEEHAGATRLSYDVEADIGGKLAQLGGRLINSVAKKTADQFFERFSAIVSER